MRVKKEFLLLAIVIVCSLFYLFTRPFLFFSSDAGVLLAVPASPGTAFSIRFIHSVQKTPVQENLIINDAKDGFILQSTKYQSFGVGLPFLLSEGNFRQEGDYFIFDDMERHFPSLSLRTGVGTQLTILYKGTAYPFYENLPPGSRITLIIAPYYARFY